MKKFVFIFIALSISLGAYCSTSFVSLDSIRTYEISEEPSSLTVRLTTDSTIWGAQMILSVPKNMSVTTSDIRLESTRVPQNKGYQLRSKMLSDTTVLIVISPSVAVTHFTTDTLDLFHVGYDWSELPILGHRYPITISDILMISNEGLSSYIQEPIYTFFEYAEKPKYEITFLGYDGTVLLSDSVPLWELPSYTGATPIKPATAQYTFTFAGWSPSISPATSDAVYTAQFDSVVNKYTITFVDEDGTPLQTSEVEYGQVPAYNGVTPSKSTTAQFTFTFSGWSPEVAAVTSAATYTATYSSTINSYLITFVNYDGTTLQSGVVNYGATPAYMGETPTKPATAQYTYTFKGWDKTIVSVVGIETYTAQFDSIVNKYTITFVDEDGTTLQTSEVEYGQVPAYNGATPSKKATAQYTYTFSGWTPEVVSVTAAATYTATYSSTINSYLISFVNYDGTTLQSGNVNYGVTPAYTGTTPTKPATAQYTYTFKGWDNEIVSVVGAETYSAQFDSVVNKYTITFVDEDGTTLQTSEVEYGQIPAYNGATPFKPATAQYTYAFAGWSPEVVAVTAAATYTATYSSTINSYLITFVNYDGTTLQSGVVNYGATPAYMGETPTKPATAQYTYTFKGWDKEIVSVVGAEVYMAQFDSVVNKYTISFVDEDGTPLQTSEVEYGQVPAYNGATPSKASTSQYTYTFAGWSPNIVAVTCNATYTATYTDATNGYLITFVNYDGSTLQSGVVNYGVTPIYNGTTPTKPATAQYTYTFAGWDKEIVSVVGAETYTAQFDSVVNKYTITFVDEDGTTLQTSEVEYGQVPAYNGTTPSKTATAQYTYAFAGWTPEVVAVTGAATYTATYSSTVNSYLITFVNYDGTTLQSGNVNYGITPAYTGITPTKPATAQYTYTFAGWDKEIVSVIGVETYTAQYDSVINKYTITFVDEDGTTLQTSEVEYGQIPAYNGTTPSKQATAQYTYAFAGWSPEVVAVTAAATYTATYSSTINSYLIAFVNYDGTTLQSGVVNYGATPAYMGETPTKPATAQYTYTFKGWDKEIVSVVGAEVYTAQFDSVVNKYTITFVDEDGTTLQTSEVEYGQVPAYNGTTPFKPSTGQFTYTFAGWSPNIVAVTCNATYTATYTDATNGYLITFVNYDGSTLQSGVVNYGVTPIYNGTTPTKPATAQYTYTFKGWDKEIVSVVGVETYTAQFDSIVNKYTITFVDEDGTTLQTSEVEYGQIPAYNGATPSKSATGQYTYAFAGWSPEVVAVTGVATYTATYSSTINSYLITFVNYDGATLQSGVVNYGVTPAYNGTTPTKPATAQYTYTFAGWDKEIVSVVGAEVYMAQFDSVVNKYTISFVDEDGTPLQTSEVEYGQVPAYNGATPSKSATAQYTYAFAGWTPEVVAVTGVATYTATYTSTTNSYQITFVNYDGATLQSGNVNYGVTPTYTGATPTKPATAQYTYTFKGWDKEIVSVVGVETYTAQFDSVVNKYTITFVDEDGTVLQTSEVEYGQVPAYNGTTPFKPSTGQFTYTFAGWSPNIVAVTCNATYTATYTDATNGYLITFVNYDGSTLQSGVVNYGVTPAYNGTTPTKPATAQYTYTFAGWDKEIVAVVGAETYTAQFDSVVNKYTITFVDEDGTVLQTSEVEYGQVPAYNGATPSKSATAQYTYAFAGWSPEVVAVTGATTYTATYSSTVNSYLITFVNYDGTTLQSSEVNYGVTPAYAGATPTKPATAQYTYTFAGWDKEIVSVVSVETYTAQFDSVVNQYTISVIGDNCTITGDGTYDYGTEVTLSVTPDEGYWFVQWSDGVVDATRQIVVTEDATYTAIVEEHSVGTGWQENNQTEQVQKIYDGTHYYILRGGKRYTMRGQEVR